MRPAKDFLPKGAPNWTFRTRVTHPAFGIEKFHPGNPGWNSNSSVIAKRRVWDDSYCNGSATRLLTPHKIANATAQLARKREVRQGGKALKCGATETRPAPVTRRASKAGSHPKRIRSTSTSEPRPGRTRNESAIGCIEGRQHASPIHGAPAPKAHPKRAANLTLPSCPLRKARYQGSYRPPSSRSTGS